MPTALITGATRGIGRAIALRLAPTHDIIAVGRGDVELHRLLDDISAIGGTCQPVRLDLRRPDAIASALGGSSVDVLVNNAGVMHKKPLLQLEASEWHEMVDVNYNALFHVTRAVLPGMMLRGSGHIVNIASIAGRSAFFGGAGYASTKHAVIGFSESLMLEVRDHGVRVSVVCPGSVATGMVERDADTSWMLTPDDVAQAVAGILATPPHALVFQLEVRASQPRK
ncbi:MAG: NADP-dependent 3-hydroxy acid dehydrogenase YdfG [Gemmatimonadaceae bacterium]|nr:NADP-dependent 3-hydroxy acid dehydrogenase YdfG [Gemmatimonadaceae bacterium]